MHAFMIRTSVRKALREDASSLSPFGLLIDDVKSIANSFDELSYSHTLREKVIK